MMANFVDEMTNNDDVSMQNVEEEVGQHCVVCTRSTIKGKRCLLNIDEKASDNTISTSQVKMLGFKTEQLRER